MTPARAQLDAAEAWLLEDFRALVSDERFTRHNKRAFSAGTFAARWWALQRRRLTTATVIRAIRAQRKALVCVMCGETIRPGTMNGYECSLTREGWLCGALSHTKHAVGDEP
jgi:hypothetical protein